MLWVTSWLFLDIDTENKIQEGNVSIYSQFFIIKTSSTMHLPNPLLLWNQRSEIIRFYLTWNHAVFHSIWSRIEFIVVHWHWYTCFKPTISSDLNIQYFIHFCCYYKVWFLHVRTFSYCMFIAKKNTFINIMPPQRFSIFINTEGETLKANNV